MKLKDIFLTASANMFRSKLRTILTILAIFIGGFTLTLTNGIGAGISGYIDKQVNTIGQKDVITITVKSTDSGIGASDTPQKYDPTKVSGGSGSDRSPSASAFVLTESDIAKLKNDTDIKDIQPMYILNPDYIESTNSEKYKFTVSPISGAATLDLAAGQQVDTVTTENQLILPLSYVSALGFSSVEHSINQKVTISVSDALGEQHIIQATVVGVQQKGIVSSSGVALNPALMRDIYNQQTIGLPDASKNKYQSATARIVGDLGDAHMKAVKDKLDSLGYSGQTTSDMLGTFKSVISVITWVLNGFAIIALLAASFGIVNTLLMSVQERTKEIGLMKSMGMSSARIFLLFSTEAVLIGFWGSAIGVGMAIVVGNVANRIVSNGILKDLPGFNLLVFPIQSIVFIMLLIMAIAFLAGTLPARRASRLNPIDALRYE